MSQESLQDSQEIRIIDLESEYWKNFEEEVRFNSGCSPTLEQTPQYLVGLNNKEPMDIDTKVIKHPDVSDSDEESNLIIDTDGDGEYIEDIEGDPLIDPNNVKVDSDENTPLDLSVTRMEASEKSKLFAKDKCDTSN